MQKLIILLPTMVLATSVGAQCTLTGQFAHREFIDGSVSFISQSIAGPDTQVTSYIWDFGDGTQSTEAEPTHVFPASGLYDVCLTISGEDSQGSPCSDMVCEQIYVGCSQVKVLLSSDDFQGTTTLTWSSDNILTDLSLSVGVPDVIYTWDLVAQTVSFPTLAIVPDSAGFYQYELKGMADGVCHFSAVRKKFSWLANEADVWNLVMKDGAAWSTVYSPECDVNDGFGIGGVTGGPAFQNPAPLANGAIRVGDLLFSQTGIQYVSTEYWIESAGTSCDAEGNQFGVVVNVQEVSSFCQAALGLLSPMNTYAHTFINQSMGGYNSAILDYGDGSSVNMNVGSIVNHLFAPGTNPTVTLTIQNPQTGCYSQASIELEFPEAATICGHVFFDENINGIWDPGEEPVEGFLFMSDWQCAYSADTILITNDEGFFSFWGYPNQVCVVEPWFLDSWNWGPGPYYSYEITVNTLNGDENTVIFGDENTTNCTYLIGIAPDLATYCGKAYFDENNSGTHNPGEPGIPFATITLSATDYWFPTNPSTNPTVTITTDANGDYCTTFNAGTVSLSASNPSNSLPSIPVSINLNTQFNSTNENLNFGFYWTAQPVDWAVSVSGDMQLIGFETVINVQLLNYGSAASDGTMVLSLPEEVEVINSTGNYTISTNPHQVEWILTNIQPHSVNVFPVTVHIDSLTTPNTPAIYSAFALDAGGLDANPANNFNTWETEFVAAYDPNNKIVSPHGIGEEGFIPTTTNHLEYVINFQNTGSAPAVNVWVRDTISPHLDLASIHVMQASHAFEMSILERRVTFKFPEIMLPDSSADLEGSKGFVKFRIALEPGLPIGTQIKNTAYIFFDFNEAIITNTTVNTLHIPDNITEIGHSPSGLQMFPNPTDAEVQIINPFATASSANLQVYSALGALVIAKRVSDEIIRLDVSDLPRGLYVVRIDDGNQAAVGRLVVR